MKIPIQCPSCGCRYQIERSKLSGGAAVACARCGKRWNVRLAAPGAPASRPGTSPSPPPTAAAGTPPAKAPAAQRSLPADRVLCPQCGHVFPYELSAGSAETRHRILVAEDQDYFYQLAKEALGEEYDTIAVRTPAAALREIARCRPDLLVLDLLLADGGHGKEVLEKLTDRTFPILIFTSKDEREMFGKKAWDELKQLGASDILIKGMNVADDLQRKVEHLLQSS